MTNKTNMSRVRGKKPTKKAKGDSGLDLRIENVLERLAEWSTQGAAELGRFMEHLMGQFDWGKIPPEKLTSILTAVMENVDDEELDHLDSIATGEARIYLEVTVGNEACAALEKCGLSPVEAERFVHKTIAQAKRQAVAV